MIASDKSGPPTLQLRTILLPTDFSGCGNFALPYAAAIARAAKAKGICIYVVEVIAHGDAAAEIVRVAAESNVDLIVISSHGRTGLGRMIFGSTAEAVVRHAGCPVLVVKPPPEEEGENQ